MAVMPEGPEAARARISQGPGRACKADCNQAAGPPRAALWQTAQLPAASCLARWAKRKVACCLDNGPGLMNPERKGPHSATSRKPMVRMAVQRVNTIRLERRLRTGTHGARGRQQVPSGSGPPAHGPPDSAGRV